MRVQRLTARHRRRVSDRGRLVIALVAHPLGGQLSCRAHTDAREVQPPPALGDDAAIIQRLRADPSAVGYLTQEQADKVELPEFQKPKSDNERKGQTGYLMDAVRQEAAELARAGVIEVTQGDDAVSISEARGPVRLRRGPRWGGA